jgi:hypothetical protein
MGWLSHFLAVQEPAVPLPSLLYSPRIHNVSGSRLLPCVPTQAPTTAAIRRRRSRLRFVLYAAANRGTRKGLLRDQRYRALADASFERALSTPPGLTGVTW